MLLLFAVSLDLPRYRPAVSAPLGFCSHRPLQLSASSALLLPPPRRNPPPPSRQLAYSANSATHPAGLLARRFNKDSSPPEGRRESVASAPLSRGSPATPARISNGERSALQNSQLWAGRLAGAGQALLSFLGSAGIRYSVQQSTKHMLGLCELSTSFSLCSRASVLFSSGCELPHARARAGRAWIIPSPPKRAIRARWGLPGCKLCAVASAEDGSLAKGTSYMRSPLNGNGWPEAFGPLR